MKDLKISKELLIEVLGSEYKQRLVDWFQIEDDNFLRTYYDCGSYDDKGRPTGLGLEINIYEFAFKCKEWAYTNKYRLSSGQHRLNTKQEHYINNQIASYFCSVYYITNDDSDIQIDANTEPEAIFKACQWILENIK